MTVKTRNSAAGSGMRSATRASSGKGSVAIAPGHELWVFGYGSLMWRPGFAHVERHPATLRGAHRSLCLYSMIHRGTKEQPGLVLGLDRGGSCRGVAYRVEASAVDATLAYLREREQPNYAYREVLWPVRLNDGRTVEALTYVVDRAHPQYAGVLTPDAMLPIIRGAEGQSGRNVDYIRNTAAELAKLRIQDATLTWLLPRL